jgi:hypothetical protein
LSVGFPSPRRDVSAVRVNLADVGVVFEPGAG